MLIQPITFFLRFRDRPKYSIAIVIAFLFAVGVSAENLHYAAWFIPVFYIIEMFLAPDEDEISTLIIKNIFLWGRPLKQLAVKLERDSDVPYFARNHRFYQFMTQISLMFPDLFSGRMRGLDKLLACQENMHDPMPALTLEYGVGLMLDKNVHEYRSLLKQFDEKIGNLHVRPHEDEERWLSKELYPIWLKRFSRLNSSSS